MFFTKLHRILDEYYDKHIVCFKCANFYFSSKKDPMNSECQFISLLPLVRLDNDELKRHFEDYFSNELIDFQRNKEIMNRTPEERRKKVTKIIALLIKFFLNDKNNLNVSYIGNNSSEVEKKYEMIKEILENLQYNFPLQQ